MTIPNIVSELVDRFQDNIDAYKSGRYNETQVRQEFINPLFEALGWDIYNRQGYAESYKDVVHEDAIKIGEVVKAPDYCFRIGGTRKFFLEAKKPSINIKEDVHPAYQLRRYAWSAKLPLSILTDFEEFAVYDCRIKPIKNDKPSVARILYINFKEYIPRWQEIVSIYSREAILKGSFDKYVESNKAKHGTAEVDTAFLQEIERWREAFARNIALRNPDLNYRELNFAVQTIIDRIIFLRISEDRGIEPYGRLMALQNDSDIYSKLCQLFRLADARYNSGLFHFNEEKGRPESPDGLTLNLSIDDKVLKDVFKNLYYPDSPYEFSVLPADILGQVYEQFLGKIIRLTSSHRAVVEEKPEVKKAGGIYYTPTYIVDYIIQNTVGNLLQDITPKQAAEIKVLDPACGSGSFLLNAYQYLLDWHLNYYITENDPYKLAKGKNPQIHQGSVGEWRLTINERKRILLNSIYGVDIDQQAVEVTKLSLLLKVLEQDYRQLPLLQEQRVLPDLGCNIKCGNSLFGSNFYDNKNISFFNEDELLRINAFDWQSEFSGIMESGGFNVVIGNPPYVDIKGLPKADVDYIFKYFSLSSHRINLFAAFIEKAMSLVRSSRFRFSMIVPTAILTQESYRALRRFIIENYHVASIVRLPNESFGSSAGDVKVDTVIVVLQQRISDDAAIEIIAYTGYDRVSQIDSSTAPVHEHIAISNWSGAEDCIWTINTADNDQNLIAKCEKNSLSLIECADFCLGLTPYDKYRGHTKEQIDNKVYHANYQKDHTYKKLLAGNDVLRYIVRWNGEKWISYGPWLGATREQRFFIEQRILVKQIIDWTSKRIWAAITSEELYNTQNAFNILPKQGWSAEFILGIINSRLMSYYHRKKFLDEFKMRFQKVLIKNCKCLPIHSIDYSSRESKRIHDTLIESVKQMQHLNMQMDTANDPHLKITLQRQINVTDRYIDELIYELYELTPEEIDLVESNIY